jgi:hypothetical protein
MGGATLCCDETLVDFNRAPQWLLHHQDFSCNCSHYHWSCTCAKSTCANNNRNPHAHAQQQLAYVSDLVHRCWVTNEEAEYQRKVIDYGYQSQLDKDEYHSKYPCAPHMRKIFFSTSTHNPESSGLLQPSRDTIATMLRAEAIRTWTTKAFIATLLGAVLTIFLLSGGKEHDDSLVRVVAPE